MIFLPGLCSTPRDLWCKAICFHKQLLGGSLCEVFIRFYPRCLRIFLAYVALCLNWVVLDVYKRQAHRLSSIRNVDEILVLEDGKIAERGTDAALMATDTKYRKYQTLYEQANEWRVVR